MNFYSFENIFSLDIERVGEVQKSSKSGHLVPNHKRVTFACFNQLSVSDYREAHLRLFCATAAWASQQGLLTPVVRNLKDQMTLKKG